MVNNNLGIITRPTDMGGYIAGDAKRSGSQSEMVVPLENTGFIKELAGAVGTAVQNKLNINNGINNNKVQPIDLTVKIGDSTFAKKTIQAINNETRKAGRNLIEF